MPWLHDEDPIFLTQLVMALQPEVFVPQEIILLPALHVVQMGSAIYGGALLRKGDIWGADMLIQAGFLRSRWRARAISYLESFFVTRDDVFRVAAPYEDTTARLRRVGRFLALRRYIILVAKASKGLATHEQAKAMPAEVRSSWARVRSKNVIDIVNASSKSVSKGKQGARPGSPSFGQRVETMHQRELEQAMVHAQMAAVMQEEEGASTAPIAPADTAAAVAAANAATAACRSGEQSPRGGSKGTPRKEGPPPARAVYVSAGEPGRAVAEERTAAASQPPSRSKGKPKESLHERMARMESHLDALNAALVTCGTAVSSMHADLLHRLPPPTASPPLAAAARGVPVPMDLDAISA